MKNKFSKTLFIGSLIILFLLFTARMEFAQKGADGLQRNTPTIKNLSPNRASTAPKSKSLPVAKKFKPRPAAMIAVPKKSQPTTAKYWDAIKRCGDDEDCQLPNYTKIVTLDPRDEVAYHNRGIIYTDKENYEAAIGDFTKSIALNQTDDQTYSARAYAFGQRKNGDHDIQAALADYSRAIQLNPQNAETYNRRGNFYSASLGENDAAIKDFTKAIQLKPDYAEAYFNRGFAYAGVDNRQALSDYNQAIRYDSNNDFYYGIRASLFEEADDYKMAINDYTKQISLNAQNAQGLVDRGKVYIAKGDYDSAISDFTKAIAADPVYAGQGYSLRGKSYSLKGDYVNALRDFNKSIELSPEGSTYYLERANSYVRQKNYTAAIADATKAMSFTEGFLDESQIARGGIYCAQGNYTAAMNDFNTILQKRNPFLERTAYLERGKCFFQKGDYHAAISDFTKLVELEANFKDLYSLRAAAYRKIGATNLAVADEQKALELQKERKLSVENISASPAAEEIKPMNLGVLNGRAITLIKSEYQSSTGATGTVNVQVIIDENGNVTSAEAVTGDARLRQSAETAAKVSKFRPEIISGHPVKFTGIIIYTFSSK